jgi:hypothetical protein
MRIISFCNKQAYAPYEYLIKSAEKLGFTEKHQFTLYTVDFEVSSPHPQVTYKYIPLEILSEPEHARRIKPSILLQALKDFQDESMLYLDTDHIIGKRFNPDLLLSKASTLITPLASYHTCNLEPNWKKGLVNKINYVLGTNYDFTYTQTNVVLFGQESKSFIEKWAKLCLTSPYTEKLNFTNYPAGDEIVYNSILCRVNGKLNLGQCHANVVTHNKYYFHLMEFGEKYENMYNNPGMTDVRILNTSDIMVYHGCKNIDLLKQYV